MIIVIASVIVQEGRFAEALALSGEHVARSRSEPGCIAHAVHRDTENPLRLVFVEQWASHEALSHHFRVPASKTLAKAITGLAAEAPSIALYEASPLPMPGKDAA